MERLLKYATYVKVFLYGDDSYAVPLLPIGTLEVLRPLLPGGLIFPRIKILRWVPWSEGPDISFPCIHLVVGPHLKEMVVQVHPEKATEFLYILSSRYLSLEHVGIHTYPDPPALDASTLIPMSFFLHGLLNITMIDVDILDDAALEHLSRLPSLERLTIRVPNPDHWHRRHYPVGVQGPGVHVQPFPSLQTLSFRDTRVETATAMISKFPNCNISIKRLEIHPSFSHPPTNSRVQECWGAMAIGLLPSVLENLVMHINMGWDDQPQSFLTADVHAYIIATQSLEVLHRFTNLVVVDLALPVGFDMDNPCAWSLAQAWPRVEKLILRTPLRTPFHHPPSMTVTGLLAFATHCRKLKQLHITFDGTQVLSPTEMTEAPISQGILDTLGVGHSPITSVNWVGIYLSAIFPSLFKISTYLDELEEMLDDSTFARHWRRVEHIVLLTSIVRAQERIWAGGI